MIAEVVPPRKGWSLSVTESQRNPVKVQSTVIYAKNMGVRITPIHGWLQEIQFGRYSKKGFAGKNAQLPSCNERASCKQNASFAQLSVKIAKLEKSNKKLKHMKKKRKRKYVSDSNDLDSSWSDGSSSTGNLVNISTKHNKINHDVRIYPSLTKATENLDLKNLNQNNTL